MANATEMHAKSVAGQVAIAHEESERGFRSQMSAIAEAFRAGNDTQGHQLIDELRIPNAEAFFLDNFSQDEAARLTERYVRAFDDYALSLEHTVKDVIHHPESKLMQKLIPGNPKSVSQMAGRLTSLTPQHEQSMYRLNRRSA
jgi:hypothetical protein